MITDVIVFTALVFAAIFSAAWLALPNLRKRVERPKYGFQENVQRYEQSALRRERSR